MLRVVLLCCGTPSYAPLPVCSSPCHPSPPPLPIYHNHTYTSPTKPITTTPTPTYSGEKIVLPEDALSSADTFVPAAVDAVLKHFQWLRMRGKRGRMPLYKPDESLKKRDAETFPIALNALVCVGGGGG